MAALEGAETLFEFDVLLDEFGDQLSDEQLDQLTERELELRRRQDPDAEREAEFAHVYRTQPERFRRDYLPMLRELHAVAFLRSHLDDPRVRGLLRAELAQRRRLACLPRKRAGRASRSSSRRFGCKPRSRSPARPPRPSDDPPSDLDGAAREALA